MNTVVHHAEAIINGGTPWPCEVTIEQDTEWVPSDRATMPDPKWEFTDGNGHFHAFADKGELPTLNTEIVEMPCDGSCGGVCNGEGYTEHRYTCRICGEEIKPRWVPDWHARTVGVPISGPKSANVVVHSDRPLGRIGDEVTVLIKAGGPELLGVGRIYDMEGVFGPEQSWTTSIAPRSLETRMNG